MSGKYDFGMNLLSSVFQFVALIVAYAMTTLADHRQPTTPTLFRRFRIATATSNATYALVHRVGGTPTIVCQFRTASGSNSGFTVVPCRCVLPLSNTAMRHGALQFQAIDQEANSISDFNLTTENAVAFVAYDEGRSYFGTLFRRFGAKISLKIIDDSAETAERCWQNAIWQNNDTVTVDVELRYRPLQYLSREMFAGGERNVDPNAYYHYSVVDGTKVLARRRIELHLNGNPTSVSFDCTLMIRRGWYAVRPIESWRHTEGSPHAANDLKWILFNETNDIPSATRRTTTTRPTATTTIVLPKSANNVPPPPFHLWLRNDSIFPSCVDELTLSWRLTHGCDASTLRDTLDFRVRLYAETRGDSRAAEWIYMEEFGTNTTGDSSTKNPNHFIAVPCARFDIVHERFCFELVSVERATQHFERWHRKCVPTEPVAASSSTMMSDEDNPVGLVRWAEWTAWSSCVPRFLSGCVVAKRRKRKRYCVTTNGGQEVKPTKCTLQNGTTGSAEIETEACALPNDRQMLCDVAANGTLASMLTSSTCECGCNITLAASPKTSADGTLFIGTPKCGTQQGKRQQQWQISVPTELAHQRLSIQFTIRRRRADGRSGKDGIIRIYGGGYDRKQLIWISNDKSFEENLAIVPKPSSLTAIHIVYDSPAVIINGGGFYVSYAIMDGGDDEASTSDSDFYAKESTLFAEFHALMTAIAPLHPRIAAALAILLLLGVIMVPPLLCALLTMHKRDRWHSDKRRRNSDSTGTDDGKLIASLSSAGTYDERWNRETIKQTQSKTYNNYNNVGENNYLDGTVITIDDAGCGMGGNIMQRSSANTNSTQLTGDSFASSVVVGAEARQRSGTTTTRRSIGIQLSRQSTPRLGCTSDNRRRRTNVRRSKPSSANSTSVDVAADELDDEIEDDELEYDYYEPPHPPGSFLRDTFGGGEPWLELVSEISDIVFSDVVDTNVGDNHDVASLALRGKREESESIGNQPDTAHDIISKQKVTPLAAATATAAKCDAHTQIPLSTLLYRMVGDDDDSILGCADEIVDSTVHIV